MIATLALVGAIMWAVAGLLPESRKHWCLAIPILAGIAFWAFVAYAALAFCWAWDWTAGVAATLFVGIVSVAIYRTVREAIT